jgi:hypothetical protein
MFGNHVYLPDDCLKTIEEQVEIVSLHCTLSVTLAL